ncbi:MAG: NADH-quinone oxidoreductase subunit B family protein [Peptococcales bacterium]|jgi:Ni,Fe-hydrogenase III small subunit
MLKQFWKILETGIVTEKLTSNGKRSVHIRQVDTGSCNGCDWEMNTLLNPIYDVQRFGLDFVASPRHADILLVTGAATKNLAKALKKTYDATPEPKIVIALGDCACGNGIFKDNYAVYGVENIVPVDAYIPGCPPEPESIIKAILSFLDK